MIKNIRIVLVKPSHPGNIGAVARAMKAMNLNRLVLVSPKQFPAEEASARAVGANDLLEKALVVDQLSEGIRDCEIIFGTSARSRHLEWPVLTPRASGEMIQHNMDKEIAILFGNEQNGLSNDELALCQYHIVIPTTDYFQSLNLAAAVQIIAYEIFFSLSSDLSDTIKSLPKLATSQQREGLYQHLEKVMIEANFLNPNLPRQLMAKLKRFFNRSHLEEAELNILRGFLTAVEKRLN